MMIFKMEENIMTKKILALILVLALSLTFLVACGKDEEEILTDSSSDTNSQITDSSSTDDSTVVDESAPEEGSLEYMMADIYAGVDAPINALANNVITAENSMYMLGLENLDDVEEAIVSESMIGSIAHSVGLVRVKEGSDVEAVKAEMAAGIDPQKWICVGVEPELVIVESVGNIILLVLDTENGQAFLDGFNALA